MSKLEKEILEIFDPEYARPSKKFVRKLESKILKEYEMETRSNKFSPKIAFAAFSSLIVVAGGAFWIFRDQKNLNEDSKPIASNSQDATSQSKKQSAESTANQDMALSTSIASNPVEDLDAAKEILGSSFLTLSEIDGNKISGITTPQTFGEVESNMIFIDYGNSENPKAYSMLVNSTINDSYAEQATAYRTAKISNSAGSEIKFGFIENEVPEADPNSTAALDGGGTIASTVVFWNFEGKTYELSVFNDKSPDELVNFLKKLK